MIIGRQGAPWARQGHDQAGRGRTATIRKLAAAAGHPLPAGGASAPSKTRDRITIAAGAVALAAVLAAIVFWRRERKPAPE